MAAKQNVGFYLHNHFHEWLPCPDDLDAQRRGRAAAGDRPALRVLRDGHLLGVRRPGAGRVDPEVRSAAAIYAIKLRDRYRLFHVKDGTETRSAASPPLVNMPTPARGPSTSRRSSARCSRSARARSTSTPTSGSATTRPSTRAARWPRRARATPTSATAWSARTRRCTRTACRRPSSARVPGGRRPAAGSSAWRSRATSASASPCARRAAAARSRANASRSSGAGGAHVELRLPRGTAGGPAQLELVLTGPDGVAHKTRLTVVVPASA